MLSIAIVGQGFGGLATAYHLVQQTNEPIYLYLFEKALKRESRIAFSTNCPQHLLNVPAGKMGLPADDPEHFVKWLNRSSQWRQLDSSFVNLTVDKNSFLPRMLYGHYLEAVERELVTLAEIKKCVITAFCEEVIDADWHNPQLILKTSAKKEIIVDRLVLAISSPWTQPIPHQVQQNYYHAPWPTFTQMECARPILQKFSASSEVAIIGSGLTMLDMLATLNYCHYKGRITVVSGKNLIPHLWGNVAPTLKINPAQFHDGALTAFKAFRKLCQLAPWQQVLDALRPYTQEIWQYWPLTEKKLFLRRLFGFWNTHRHRAPAYALHWVDFYKQTKRLHFIKGTVKSVKETDQQPQLTVTLSDTHETAHYAFDLIINSTGPSFVIKRHTSLLIQNLLLKQMIAPDEIGLGIKQAHLSIHALGSLLFGSLFETTAVPEIRKEAHQIASQILSFSLKG